MRVLWATAEAVTDSSKRRGLNTVAEQEPLRNHDAVKLIGWTVLGYAWRIAGSLLQIIFALYIFSRLEDRFDTIVVAISGLIYVSILSIDLYFITNELATTLVNANKSTAP